MNISIRNDIKHLASTLPIGGKGYFTCPGCGKVNKISVSNTPTGILYHCFSNSCSVRSGNIPVSMSKESIIECLDNNLRQIIKPFVVPEYFIDGLPNEDCIKFANRYDLLGHIMNKSLKTAYDPRMHRQVFFYMGTRNNIVGAMGRALSPSIKPKAYIYPGSEKTLFVLGTSPIGVVVEDILSAARVASAGYTGIALSGTSLPILYAKQLEKYTSIIVALDKDASIKSLELKKLIDIFCKNVIIQLLDMDFKDMTTAEAKSCILSSIG